jgi:acetylornithine deacetylase/succinyl-diaminopimelate desuccinylase-like protein
MGSVKELQDKVLSHLDDDEIVAFHQASVRIPSVTGNEKQYAEFLYAKMEEFGFDDREVYEARGPERPNAWGRVKGSGGGRSLLLENHTDTVPVAGWEERWEGTPQENPFSAEIVNGELWGRGSLDNKAGMTASMMVMKALKEAGVVLKGDVILSGTIDEEGASSDSNNWGMRALAEAYLAGRMPKADFCIWTDCTDGMHVYISQYSLVLLEVTIRGKMGYCGTPWVGVNAITKTMRFLERLEEYGNKRWEEKFDPLQGHPTNLVFMVQAGSPGYFVVPDECTVGFLLWGVPGDEPKRMYQDVESILRKIALDEGLEWETKIVYGGDTGYGMNSVGISEDEPMVGILAKSLEQVTGKTNMVTGAPYIGETPWIIWDMNIPTVYFGPGVLACNHTLEERCRVEELLQFTKILALSVVEYCSG